VLQLRALAADDEPDWVEEREALTEALIAVAEATPTAMRAVIGRLREALSGAAEPLRLATAQVLGRVGDAEHGALGGLEPLEVEQAEFTGRLRLENHTLKRALTDPTLFSGIGNA
jgi:hypothetical protein